MPIYVLFISLFLVPTTVHDTEKSPLCVDWINKGSKGKKANRGISMKILNESEILPK